MDIYQVISKRVQTTPIDIQVNPAISSVPNNSESKKQGRKKYPLILMRKGKACLLLEEHEAFVWQLLQKGESLKDINIMYYFKYKKLGSDYIRFLINDWYKKGLLLGDKNFYENLLARSRIVSAINYNARIVNKIVDFLSFKVSIAGTDGVYSFLYRLLKALFNRTFFIVISTVAVIGLTYSLFFDKSGEVIFFESQHWLVNLLILLGINMLYIFVHESGHALAMKHYGLKVEEVGIRFFLGYPVFYVDSTSSWSLPRANRIVISAGGIIANLVTAGIIGGLKFFISNPVAGVILNQFIFVSLVSVAVNLIPFVEFDGYYMVIDLLNEPNLKARSLKVVEDLISEDKKVDLSDVKFLLVFAVLSVITSLVFIYLSMWFWVSGLDKIF